MGSIFTFRFARCVATFFAISVATLSLSVKATAQVVGWGTGEGGSITGVSGLTNLKQIASGFGVTIGLTNTGSLMAAGDDIYSSGILTPPSGNDYTQISCTYQHALALKDDGTVAAWGYNGFGQTTIPNGLTNVIQVAAGQLFSVALKDDGTVVAWGDNRYGESTVPNGLSGVIQISAGLWDVLALKSDGTVVGWGYNQYGEDTVPNGLTGVVQVAAGDESSYALLSNGTVTGWGSNNYSVPAGLSGVVEISTSEEGDVLCLKSDGTVVGFGGNADGETNIPSNLYGVTSISAGTGQSLAIVGSQSAIGWGSAGFDVVNVPLPNAMKSVAEGALVSAVLLPNGTPFSWGNPDFGDFEAPDLTGVTQIACSQGTVLALLDDGTVVGWGDNSNGILNVPNGLTDVKAISAGDDFGMALKDDGSVVVWGTASAGETILPTFSSGSRQFPLGNINCLALLDNGTLVAWGDNFYGESSVPPGLTGVASISAGATHGLALFSNGTAEGWGDNSDGETGFSGITGITEVLAGFHYSEALLSNGTVQSIGFDAPASVPTGLAGCSYLSLGGNGTLALASPIVQSVSLASSTVVGGNPASVTVTMSPVCGPANTAVAISGTGPLTLPSPEIITGGASSVTFSLPTSSTGTQQTQTITATLNGASATATLTITPLTISIITDSQSGVEGGNAETLTVYLNGAAGPAGAVVSLQGTGPCTVPSSINVLPGASSASISVATPYVGFSTGESVTALLNGTTSTVSFTITAAQVQSITASPSTIVGGGTASFTVSLDSPAAAGGDTVDISDLTGELPLHVTVPAGKTSVTFTASFYAESSVEADMVTAAIDSSSESVNFTIDPPSVSRFSVSPVSVAGGENTEATIELNGVAASGGMQVALTSGNAAIAPPSVVTVPAGASTYSFVLKTKTVNLSTAVTLGATASFGSQKTCAVTVLPAGLSELIVQPTVQGGTSEEVGVFLASPAGSSGTVVHLSSNNGALVTPASVTVPSGYSSYWYVQKTSGVSSSTAVKITATVGSSSVSGTTTLTAAILGGLSLSRSTISAGTQSLATVTLTGPAGSSGTTVSLHSSSAAASVPASVLVASGASSASFAVTSGGVNASTVVTLAATLGSTSKATSLTVLPTGLDLIILSASSVTGGSAVNVTVKLTGPAGPSGAVVDLSSSSAHLTLPSSVTIAAGQSSNTFSASTSAVSGSTSATITATYNGSYAAATVTIKP